MVRYASAVYVILRIISALGLFKNRKWGFDLAVILQIITLTLMIFILPTGLMDGILSGIVLVLLLKVKEGDTKIIKGN